MSNGTTCMTYANQYIYTINNDTITPTIVSLLTLVSFDIVIHFFWHDDF